MKRAWAYIAHKRYELLFAFVLACFLAIQPISFPVSIGAWSVVVLVLFAHDLLIVKKAVQHAGSAVRAYRLEIVWFVLLLCLLGLWGFPIKLTIFALAGSLGLVLLLHENIVRRIVQKGVGDIRTKPLLGALILVVAILFSIWNPHPSAVAFLIIFLAFWLYEWDSRILAACALFFLASCPILLSLKQDASAEIMAQYAYFFLVMTVILQIVEYKRHPPSLLEDS